MPRGWESKSVEEQQSLGGMAQEMEAPVENKQGKPDLAARARRRQELDLQRERILSERTSNPLRRTALEAALREIESRIALLG
jgi:hypothetical protein